MTGKEIIETDFGRIRVSRSAGKNSLIVEVEIGSGPRSTYVRQVLRGAKIDRFREQVNQACDSVLRDDRAELSLAGE